MKTNAKKSKSAIKAVKVDANKRVIPSGASTKPRYWRVNVGKKITGTSKQRRFFETEREANEFIQSMTDTMPRKGTSAFTIPDKLAHEASALAKELELHEVSLTHAVRFFIKHSPKFRTIKVNEVIQPYLKRKENDKYRKARSISLNVFAREFGNKPVSTILHVPLQAWFDEQGWQPLNQRNYMRDIGMFFKWCKNNDFTMVNPMERVERPRVTIKTPEIYSVDEAKMLLTVAKENPDLALLEFVTFAFFTGIRVEELSRMDWNMVVWQQNEICLPEHVTKTNRPRIVPIIDALRAWIPETPRSGALFDQTNLRDRKEELFKLAGFKAKKNAFRHTFASYHAAHHRNFTEVQIILGQKTPSVLLTHYITATRQDEAVRFFALHPEPPKEEEAVPHPPAISDTQP